MAAIPNTAPGEAVYTAQCAGCHGATLRGAFGPPLSGAAFQRKWKFRGAQAMLATIKASMPPAKPGALDSQTYTDLANFILVRYGLPPVVRLRPRPRGDYQAVCVMAMEKRWLPTANFIRRLLSQLNLT